MRKIELTLLLLVSLLVNLSSCQKITPLPPPVDPPTSNTICKAPSLEKNIIGQWHFRAIDFFSASVNSERSGTITFNSDKTVVDPDSLFENVNDTGIAIVSKLFSVETMADGYYAQFGELLWIRQYGKKQQWLQSYFFTAVSNECNRIEFKLPSGNNPTRIVLTRN